MFYDSNLHVLKAELRLHIAPISTRKYVERQHLALLKIVPKRGDPFTMLISVRCRKFYTENAKELDLRRCRRIRVVRKLLGRMAVLYPEKVVAIPTVY